ncbi:histidine phosphatase family protein [Pseudoclavibacter sp. RFBI5]|uniref:histidine phosphatase family protein n=1 Tax=Pseudoclavibacter sp. RFBI5 TaxID=2080578 RepID=UPI000CE7C85B|nr:histidine phosphatase family protein [Pseudoclavibacter sp. RFBI5]PPG04202.1 histidine phosphatase family protein [Pseudoclavibacter sp. RFBI5]
MRIGLIRHGETDWNATGLLQGATDIPLNSRGLDQANDAAGLLVGQGWSHLYSSPLSRALTTAEIIGQGTGLGAPTLLPGIIERSFGELEGQKYWMPDGTRRPLDHPSIEPTGVVVERSLASIAQVAAAHPDEDSLIVCHGSVIRLVLTSILGAQAPHIGNLALSILRPGADGALVVTLLNGYPLVPTP